MISLISRRASQDRDHQRKYDPLRLNDMCPYIYMNIVVLGLVKSALNNTFLFACTIKEAQL